MAIWTERPSLSRLKEVSKNTMLEYLGIEFVDIGDDYIKATMPVDHRTLQPVGSLHGGASIVLAETLASAGANYCVDRSKKRCVGLEVNASHVKAVSEGIVIGVATPAHIGRSTQIWHVHITNEKDRLICTARVTMAVLSRNGINIAS